MVTPALMMWALTVVRGWRVRRPAGDAGSTLPVYVLGIACLMAGVIVGPVSPAGWLLLGCAVACLAAGKWADRRG